MTCVSPKPMVPSAGGLLVVSSAGICASRMVHSRYSALPQIIGPHGTTSGGQKPPGRGASPGSNPGMLAGGALETGPFIANGTLSAVAGGEIDSKGVGGGSCCLSALFGAGPIGIGGRSADCPRATRGAAACGAAELATGAPSVTAGAATGAPR